MMRLCASRSARLLAGLLLSCNWRARAAAPEPTQLLRWNAGMPGSEFSANADGTYRYGLAGKGVSVTLAVDAQELDKARRRIEPLLAVFLTIRSSTGHDLALDTTKITLEFVDHFHDRQRALDPDDLALRLKSDSGKFSEKTAHEIAGRPNRKAEAEAALADYLEAVRAMIDFLGVKALRSAPPNSGRRDSTGWVFFATRGRWIEQLSKQEQLVLRLPLGDLTVEFPFTIPPSQADINLRQRPSD